MITDIFGGVTEQHLIVTADCDPSFSQPFLKILDGVAAEGFVELGLLKQRRATAHIENGIPAVFGKVGDFIFRNGGAVCGHIDLIAQKGRTVQHILQILLKGRLKKLADALAGKKAFTPMLLVKNLGIDAQKADEILKMLKKYHLIASSQIEMDDEVRMVYQFCPTPSFVALLIFAREMIDRPEIFVYYSGGRTEPYFKQG